MAELIDIILKKEGWAHKIHNVKIVQEWRAEAAAQHINHNVFNCMIDLLKEYQTTKSKDYSEEASERESSVYDWPVRLGVNLTDDVGVVCSCQCACCVDGHNIDDTEDEDEYEDEDKYEDSYSDDDNDEEEVDDDGAVKEDDDGEDDHEAEAEGEVEVGGDDDEVKDKDDEAHQDNASRVGASGPTHFENMDIRRKEYIERKKRSCECTVTGRMDRFQRFVDAFVSRTALEDANFKALFRFQVAQFESTFASVDYHPGSGRQVIDLVHPSLYCYVKDVTQTGSASVAPVTDALFQWLPAEFHVSRGADGVTVESVSVDSYINNLPRDANEGLYSSIGQVFGKMVPQFDALLKTLHECNRLYAPNGDALKLSHCQVIVKLANIVVEVGGYFPGGHWHLEGMETERIVATGIYYYDMTNMGTNKLKFRTTVDDFDTIQYPQNGADYVTLHYGLKAKPWDERYSIFGTEVDLGQVETKEDMLLVFPNFLQHKVSGMLPRNYAEPGTRKILCFFLVSPYEQVLSTAHVAPQQQALGGTVTLEEAQQYRELLMFQRKYEIDDQTAFFERGWALCEH
jgi:hypothetical protein